MHVLITGGAGFLGARLARALLRRGALAGPGGAQQPIERLTLLDVVPPPDLGDARVEPLAGDVSDPATLARALGPGTRSVFHLAAVVSAEAEADLDLGLRMNLDATRRLLDRARALGTCPRVVFTSSVAVFGGALPARVPDGTAPTPRSSYGTEKAMCELLLNDLSRRGLVDGRALRMPTVCVRPGAPNRAASSFASGIVREPVRGVDAICPVSPETVMWLMSPDRAIENLVRGHELDAAALDGWRVLDLPGLSVTVREMVAALGRVAGEEVARRVRWEPDPALRAIVESWPGDFEATRATRLGFTRDASFDDVVRAHLRDVGAARAGPGGSPG